MDLHPLSQSGPRRPAGQGKRSNRRALIFVIAAPVSAALLLLAVTWSLDAGEPTGEPKAAPTPLVALDTPIKPLAIPTQPNRSTEAADVNPPVNPSVTLTASASPTAVASLAPTADLPSNIQDPTSHAPTFNNRPLRPVKTLRMLTTAYSPDEQSCGIFADGITASGYSVYTNGMALVAADTRLLPFGTLVSIPGYNDGKPVPVLDRGGAIKGKRLDLLYSTHERALQWGAQRLDVVVYEYADE